jgi:hypothetical protein
MQIISGVGAVRRIVRAAAAGGAYPNFTNHGGPVIASPSVRTSFWGSLWQTDAAHGNAMDRLNQYCRDLLNSNFMNVLTQYGVGGGTFADTSITSSVAAQLADSDIQGIIQQAITAGTIPEPPAHNTSDALIIFLDENTLVDDTSGGLVMCEPQGDTAFGYHDFFTTAAGNPFYYAVVPALTDACLTESCPGGDSTCSLHLAQTQEQRRTQVASHEFAEMTSDPQLSGWYDPQNGENGDICNGESRTITVGGNTWTVQRIYSKQDDVNTNGQTYCI